MNLVHELVEREVEDNPDLPRKLQEKIDNGDLPRSYFDHPVVQRFGGLVLPLAISLDGVQFNRRAGMLAIYLYNLVSGVRHMICSIRRSELCACGCRGW